VAGTVVRWFMATIPQLRRAFGDVEAQRVRLNGQPGHLLRGPGDPEFGEAERLAIQRGMALLRAGDVSPDDLRALVAESRRDAGLGPAAAMPAAVGEHRRPSRSATSSPWTSSTV
jgi:hypothetical protein